MSPLGGYWYKHKPVSQFGFNSRADPDVQCQKLLRLTDRNGKWKDLRARVISLAHSQLLKSDMGCCQDDKIHTIIQMISEEFVDLFPEDEGSSKRRHYIRQWLLTIHRIRRRNMRGRHEALKKSLKTELIDLTDNKQSFDLKTGSIRDPNEPSVNIPEIRSLELSPNATTPPFFSQGYANEPVPPKEKLPDSSKSLTQNVNPSLAKTFANLIPLRMDLTNKQPIPQNADDARLMEVLARPPARSDELNARSSNVKTSAPTSITSYPECSALPSSPSTSLAITKQPFRKFKPAISRTYTGGPSSSPSRPLSSLSTGNRSESSSSAIVTEQESYLINFLKACNPPMDHYYDCFIKAGCRNYQYLFALSTWPKETRRSFLKSLGSAEGGSKPTGMDVLVIDHFLEVAFGLAD